MKKEFLWTPFEILSVTFGLMEVEKLSPSYCRCRHFVKYSLKILLQRTVESILLYYSLQERARYWVLPNIHVSTSTLTNTCVCKQFASLNTDTMHSEACNEA